MSIGLWVGLIVSLGFAIICAWGFSMLASINVGFIINIYINVKVLCSFQILDLQEILYLIFKKNPIFIYLSVLLRIFLSCRLWIDLMIPKGKPYIFLRLATSYYLNI